MNHRLKNYQPLQSGLPASFGPGSFLIASPRLRQTPFEQTVIFVLQHNDQGTFGVVLNRPADSALKSEWQKITGLNFGERSIVQGGPIGGPIFAIHQEKSLAEMEMPGGICVSSNGNVFQQLTECEGADYRIVFGVAGWQTGQLANEMQTGSWFELETDPQHLFDDPSLMWENFLRHYGHQVWESILGSGHFPASPWLN